MSQLQETAVRAVPPSPVGEWGQLVRKLRWIGLEDEAHSLELAVSRLAQPRSGKLAGLILKRRWLGLEDEAHTLELAVRKLPADERGSVLIGPLSTD